MKTKKPNKNEVTHAPETQKRSLAKTNKTTLPWFSLLLRYSATKQSGPILTTREPGTGCLEES